MMEPDAAPAGEVRSLALGRPWDPIGGHYDPSVRSSLYWPQRKCGVQETWTQGQKSRDGAPSPSLCARGERKAPREREGKTAYPAPPRIRAIKHVPRTNETVNERRCAPLHSVVARPRAR